jgi:hypothetical protein
MTSLQPAAPLGLKNFMLPAIFNPGYLGGHALTDEEMATIEPLMQKIAQLCSTPGKEVTRIQLI